MGFNSDDMTVTPKQVDEAIGTLRMYARANSRKLDDHGYSAADIDHDLDRIEEVIVDVASQSTTKTWAAIDANTSVVVPWDRRTHDVDGSTVHLYIAPGYLGTKYTSDAIYVRTTHNDISNDMDNGTITFNETSCDAFDGRIRDLDGKTVRAVIHITS